MALGRAGVVTLYLCLAQALPLSGQGKAPSPQAATLNAAGTAFREGSAAFAAGDLKAAHAAFARAVQLAPEIAAAHSALGSVLLAEGGTEDAVAELSEARRLDPHDLSATVNLAVAVSRLGQASRAVSLFRSLPADTRFQPTEALAFATALAATGDPAAAETVLQEQLAAGAGTAAEAPLWDALGSLQAQANQLEAANQSFGRALLLDPEDASAHAHRGSLLILEAHDLPGALAELQRAVALGDTSPPTEVQLGRALSLNGQDAQALAVLRPALAAQPDSVEAQYALALALQASSESREALPLFEKVVAARPKDPTVLTNYGLALVQNGNAKAGLAAYVRAAAIAPPPATLREDTGVAYLQVNARDHALEQFHAGLAIDSDNPQLHYDLGLALKLKDDLTAAVPELERAEALDPHLADPPYTLGVLRLQQGKLAEAAQQLSLATTLAPENGAAWALLGSVEKDLGEPEKATVALQKAIALQPDQPSSHINLAAVLSSQGDRAGALAERRTAATLSRTAMSRQRAGFALESGRALLEQGKLAEALVQLNEAIAAQPDLPEAHLLLAETLQKQGHAADALAERQTAERLTGKQAAP